MDVVDSSSATNNESNIKKPTSLRRRVVAKRERKFDARFLDLTPKWKEVEIQIYVLGIRNMHRTVGALTKPFVSIHFPNGVNLATDPSNLPSPNSPNFCQFFTVKHQLPVQSIFAPAIRVAVRDTAAISKAQKRIGWAFIELEKYLND